MKHESLVPFQLILALAITLAIPGLADAQTALGSKGQPASPPTPWQSLPPLRAGLGVTALAGQVLTIEGQPVPNVTLQMGGDHDAQASVTTVTDATGRFLLTGLTPGWRQLFIDGRTANRSGRTYGAFEVGFTITGGQTNVLPYTIWMPLLDTAHAVTVPSPTPMEEVLTTPRLPGLEVRIPADTVIVDHNGQIVTQVSITSVPLDRPPFPLPPWVQVPLYFTVQPGGAYLQQPQGLGARLIYPNSNQAPPGTRFDFWNYDPDSKGWYVYGRGTVTSDGTQIMPDPGVTFYEFTGAMVASPSLAPAVGPAPGNGPQGKGGEPVDLGTGLFVVDKVDLDLPGVLPITLKRTYRQNDTRSRPFGIGASHPYELWLVGDTNPWTYADLLLPDGGRIHYTRISPGTSFSDAVYQHTSTPTAFYGSQIKYVAGAWNLTLKDGTVYIIGDVAPLQAIRDRYGNQITLTRSSGGTMGNITRIVSSSGRSINLTYDNSNRITQAIDNSGRVVSYTYDASGRLWKVTDPNGGVTEYTYDASHRMLTLKDARGIVFLTNAYDANGRVSQQTLADGSTFQFAYTLDGNGNVTQTNLTDPRGVLRQVTFNASGYTLTDSYAVGQSEQQTITYAVQSGTNLTQSVTDALGRQTAYTYDTMGNVTSVTRLAGTAQAVTTSFAYEPKFNQMTSVTDPLGHTSTFTYDGAGNPTAITDPLGQHTNLTYNAIGQPMSVADPLSNSAQFGYDGTDLSTVTNPLGQSTSRFTDAVGRVGSITDPLTNITLYTYDVLNRLAQVTDPTTGQTSFTYDANANLLSVTDAKNQSTTYSYNNMDRVVSRQDALQKTETYGYDANGNLTTVTDRKGQATTYTYDGLNRQTQASYADGSTKNYTYDAGNRLTQIADSLAGTITRTYDGLDHLTQEVTPQGTVSYTYDAAGRRTSLTVAGQPTTNYSYDNANRLTQITQGSSTVTLASDAANRRTSLTLPTGTSIAYAYDVASHLTGLTYQQGATVLGTLTYTYDNAGDRVKQGGTWAATGLPQPSGTTTYNANNQMLTFGGTTLTYDFNGNLTSATDSSGTATYTWDARNRLTGISAPGLTATFAYDALGRRSTKTLNGTATSFLYDGLNPVQELAGTTPTANLLTGLGIDEAFTRTDSGGTRGLLVDGVGSTRALADNTGAVQTSYTYEPFGNTSTSGAPSSNALQYTGRENDGTGLYYYRARYYSPRLQRFISEDPVRFSEGVVNLYDYALNSPIHFTDPLGLWYIDAGIGGVLYEPLSIGYNISVQIAENGIYLTGGFGVNVGGSGTLTWFPYGTPTEGVSTKAIFQVADGVGLKAVVSFDELTGNASSNAGIGVGFGSNFSFIPQSVTTCIWCWGDSGGNGSGRGGQGGGAGKSGPDGGGSGGLGGSGGGGSGGLGGPSGGGSGALAGPSGGGGSSSGAGGTLGKRK